MRIGISKEGRPCAVTATVVKFVMGRWLRDVLVVAGAGPVTTLSSWNSKLKLCTDVEQTGPTSVQFDPVMQLNFVPPFHIE